MMVRSTIKSRSTMEMRPRYRGRVDDMAYLSPRKDAPSLGEDSGITLTHTLGGPSHLERVHQQQERDVVDEVRHELLHSSHNPSTRQRFELVSKDDLMDADTEALWSTSLIDSGAEDSILHDDSSTEDDIIIRKKYKDDTVDTRTVETMVMSFDDRSEFSSACTFFSEWRDQGVFCCGTEIGEDVTHVADQSHSMVETAATELLHRSILESADSFFSNEQAESLQKTLSEVSEEFDAAGNRVVDLTSMINMKNLCSRQDAVEEDQVELEVKTVPSEVSFRVRVLTKLNSTKKPSTWKKKHLRPLSKRETPRQEQGKQKKGMFRKFKRHFRKSKSSTTAQ